MTLLLEILIGARDTFLMAAPWLLFGLLAAGFLHVFISGKHVERFVGGRGLTSVVRAALFGVPLPICSCGVVPLAIALRRKGASRPASLSFLITTPESGVESIALTWGVMGPLMAIVRPLASLITGVVTGILAIAYAGDEDPRQAPEPEVEPEPCCEPEPSCCEPELPAVREGWAARVDRWLGVGSEEPGVLSRALRYGFVTLLDDIAFWLVVGIALTGVIAAAFPADLSVWGLSGGLLPMVLVLIAAVPMYICASASTPVAAALVAKGLSPGAALVFLLAGPATNAASVLVLTKNFGRKLIQLYLAGIVVGSLLCGLALDALLATTGWKVISRITSSEAMGYGTLELVCGIVLAALLTWRFAAGAAGSGWREVRDSVVAFFGRPSFGRHTLLALLFVALPLGWLATGLQVVRPGEAGFERRFGAIGEQVGPGLHWNWPPPIGDWEVRKVAYPRKSDVGFRTDLSLIRERRRLREESDPSLWHSSVAAMNAQPEETEYIAGDETLVEMSFSVHWGLVDARAFFFDLDKSTDPVRLYAQAAAREQLARRELDALVTTERGRLEQAILEDTQARLDAIGAGVRIDAVHVVDVHPPQEAVWSFRDVSGAREDRETRIHVANERRVGELPRARGQAEKTLVDARSKGAARRTIAAGTARRFEAQWQSYRLHPQILSDLLWLETSERLLGGREKYIVPAGSAGQGVTLWRGPPRRPPATDGG